MGMRQKERIRFLAGKDLDRRDELAETRAKVDEAAWIIASAEWSGCSGGDAVCPICGSFGLDGHKPDCRLAKFLRENQ